MITTMSKIKSRFKRFFSEIYTVSLCKKIIDSEVESKSDAELRVSEEMRKWEMRKWVNEKWVNEKSGNEKLEMR